MLGSRARGAGIGPRHKIQAMELCRTRPCLHGAVGLFCSAGPRKLSELGCTRTDGQGSLLDQTLRASCQVAEAGIMSTVKVRRAKITAYV